MGKLRCACGSLIFDSADGNPQKAVAVRDIDYSRMINGSDWERRMRDAVDSFRDAGETELHRHVISAALNLLWEKELSIFECGACGTVAIETAPESFRFR